MLSSKAQELPYLIWMNNHISGLETLVDFDHPKQKAEEGAKDLIKQLGVAFGVRVDPDMPIDGSKADSTLKDVVGKVEIVAELKAKVKCRAFHSKAIRLRHS